MAQQRRIVQNKVSKREQERMDARKQTEKENFSTKAMKVFILLVLTVTIASLALNIIIFG